MTGIVNEQECFTEIRPDVANFLTNLLYIFSRHEADMASLIENVGYSATDQDVNNLSSRQLDEFQVSKITFCMKCCTLKVTEG